MRDLVDGVVTIADAAIVRAMQLCFERMKLVVEPSGAVGLAAVLDPGFKRLLQELRSGGKLQAADGDLAVGVVLCGGNLDFEATRFWALENWQPRG